MISSSFAAPSNDASQNLKMLFWPKKSNKTQRNDGLILSLETLEERQMLAGDVTVALANIGYIRMTVGDFATAVEKFQRAITIIDQANPDGEPSTASQQYWLRRMHWNLADALRLLGRTDDARQEYQMAEQYFLRELENATDSQASRNDLLYKRGVLEYRLGNHDDSLASFKEYFAAGGTSVEVAIFMARDHLELGNPSAALEACEQAEKLSNGKQRYETLVRALAYAQLGKNKLAKQEIAKGKEYLSSGNLNRLMVHKAEIEKMMADAESALQ